MPKIIVALDFNTLDSAWVLVNQLNPEQCCLKVGSEMFTNFGTDFVKALIDKKFKVFLDLKFHDIPNTVAQSCIAAAELGVWMVNVHAAGGKKMMEAARTAIQPYGALRPILIAVTVLTSFQQHDLCSIGVLKPLDEHVLQLANLAKDSGLDGIVCSALEVSKIKKTCGSSFLTITPGIRLPEDSNDDQSRVVTPAKALELGSDYLVVGRSITRSLNPKQSIATLLNLPGVC